MNRNFILNPRMYNAEQITEIIGKCSKFVMTMMGVSNNLALLILGNGLDAAKKSPAYRTKDIKRQFEFCQNTIKKYEYGIKSSEFKFFDVADMTPDVRRIYSDDITNEDFYSYWQASGCAAYPKIKNYVMALRNKYYIIDARQYTQQEAALRADLAVTYTVLSLAVMTFNMVMEQCAQDFKLPQSALAKTFQMFSLEKVLRQWEKAMLTMFPNIKEDNCTDFDKKNIIVCSNDLARRWTSVDLVTSSLEDATNDYEEVFKTEGFKKKVIQSINAMRSLTEINPLSL